MALVTFTVLALKLKPPWGFRGISLSLLAGPLLSHLTFLGAVLPRSLGIGFRGALSFQLASIFPAGFSAYFGTGIGPHWWGQP